MGEGFPWSRESCYMYTMENHNSALGIREYPAYLWTCVIFKENLYTKLAVLTVTYVWTCAIIMLLRFFELWIDRGWNQIFIQFFSSGKKVLLQTVFFSFENRFIFLMCLHSVRTFSLLFGFPYESLDMLLRKELQLLLLILKRSSTQVYNPKLMNLVFSFLNILCREELKPNLQAVIWMVTLYVIFCFCHFIG